MIKINDGKVKYGILDITDEPMLNWTNAEGKVILVPSLLEKRENRIECVDKENGLFEVYFHGELQEQVRGYSEAKRHLQHLVDKEDYYNGNEKDYGEFEID